MTAPTLLTATQRSSRLQPLLDQHGWKLLVPGTTNPYRSVGQETLFKQYTFDNFIAAFGFMSQIALYAEKADHHPEWFNVYNRVEIGWSTHDCKGLSERDLNAVEFCDKIYAKKS
jgi:4a-hydroxytetrahydrobiopterin dehydratase